VVSPVDHLKRHSWNLIYPIFYVLYNLGLLRHFHRQHFLIGTQRHGTPADLAAHLAVSGFKNHFVAWIDPGQVKSLRKLDGFGYQWHLRIFKDGEIRCHYERTPESAPIAHFMEWGMEPRREDFVQFLGPWLVPAAEEGKAVPGNTRSQSAPAASRAFPS
jgi:hypothetical protein